MTELGASVNPTSLSSQIPQGQGTLPKFKKINEYVWKGLNADEGQCIDVGNGVKINIGERKLALREVTTKRRRSDPVNMGRNVGLCQFANTARTN